jgi:hypothetical protein
MPNLTYTLSPFLPFTKIASADANQYFTDIKTLLNTTKLDSTNVQQYGLSRDRIAAGSTDHVLINDASGHLSSEATLARVRGGLQFAPALTNNAGKAIVVNDAESAFELGSPSQAALTQSFSADITSLTAGEGIAANDAVCLALHNGTGSNVYRVFKCDSDLADRRRNFIGFATAAATVTAGVYSYTLSAALVASNVITTTINGRTYATTYASSSDATLQAVATQIATDPDVQSAVVVVVGGNQTGTDDRVITVTGKGGLSLNISAVVTAGASQATITVLNTTPASGQNVRIRNFGLLDAFTSLTLGNNYYLSGTAGGITDTPTDPAPIFVGQALTATQLFVNTNPSNYQFSTPTVFVRALGSSTNVAAGAVQDVEHFNFTSWTSGTASSAGAVQKGIMGGTGDYNNYLYCIDGVNTASAVVTKTQRYNKTSWANITNRATSPGTISTGAYSFSGFLYISRGNNGATLNTAEKWNGASWSAVTAFGTANYQGGCFTQGGLAHWSGGSASQAHDTLNSSDVAATATDNPATSSTKGGSGAAPGGVGMLLDGSGASGSYTWNGSAWSSSIAVSYTVCGSNEQGAAFGYNAGTARSYINGGSTAGAAVSTTAGFNGSTWSSDTSSTNSRSSATGGVL